MTKSAKGNTQNPGKNVKSKSGLNRSLLRCGLGKIEQYVKYKATKNNKIVFKINPASTSQECADCGHIHPDNRQGIYFRCIQCQYACHADINAGRIIKNQTFT